MFLCAQVTWCSVERLICVLKEYHRSSLKVGVHGAFLFISESF